MKTMIKRTIALLMIILFIIFSVAPFSTFGPAFTTEAQSTTFTNDLFNTSISATDTFIDYVKFNDIHVAITDKINEGKTDAQIKAYLIDNVVKNRKVAIYTAYDLYYFSLNVSINRGESLVTDPVIYHLTIQYLLSLDYVLLNDIDYSSMRSLHFLPIGVDIKIPEATPPTSYYYPFTGTFDGQGYTISNLYLADKDYISILVFFDDDDEALFDEVPVISQYAMFAHVGEAAKISNLLIKNPIWELPNAPEGLVNTSIFVGENKGLIYNCAVIDERSSASGDISGIRFNIQYGITSGTSFTAAGFVHTNYGKIYNSYYVSQNVLATGSRNRFSIKPFVYNNATNAIIEGSSYRAFINNNVVNDLTQPSGVKSYSTLELKTGKQNNNAINLNSDLSDVTYKNNPLNEKYQWYFFDEDGFPSLDGLEYVESGNYFKISNEHDLVRFSTLIQKKSTHANGLKYNRQTYVLTNNINMTNITEYVTPNVTFEGTLKGVVGDANRPLSENKYILHLERIKPLVTPTEYYYGLFSKLKGTVHNINFYKANMNINDIDLYSKTGYIGVVAGQIIESDKTIIKNVISGYKVEDPINPGNFIPGPTLSIGTMPLGKVYLGGLVGMGSGTLENVANIGLINGGTHTYSNQTINPDFYLGGIIASSGKEKLTIKNAINEGNIVGFSSNGTYQLASGTTAQIIIGGIIGQVNNETPLGNSLYYLTNLGKITSGAFLGRAEIIVKQQVGGIFGDVKGYANRITSNNQTFDNGRFENKGLLVGAYSNIYRIDYFAGIGHASTTTPKAEFSYMVNKNGLEYENFNVGTHNQYVYYAATIIDHSTGGIKLSRAYNEQSYQYGEDYFNNTKSLTYNRILIAPFFTSINDVGSDLIYVQNKGNIEVGETGKNLTATKEMRVSGITQATQVNYQNVTNSGNIDILRIINDESVFVAGIAWILPFNKTGNTPYLAKNCLFEGKIRTPNLLGNTTINTGTTDESDATTNFVSKLTVANLYVGGLFNINVGQITNSFNRGELTSNYITSSANLSHIKGTANTYVGGLVTFNYYIIQDCGNSGNIHFTNDNTSVKAWISGGKNPIYGSKYGGLIYAFNGGLTLGGLVSAFGDVAALILKDGSIDYGQNTTEVLDEKTVSLVARIYDSVNSGNVFGKAKDYVRSGGILGVALGPELTAGTFSNDSDATPTNPKYGTFSTWIFGQGDKIAPSRLYNGLNFGNITALTSTIGEYAGNVDTKNEDGDSANSQRPGILACAGGIIGYGLCQMKRMLNHGSVNSTDVAGGIVGATYILGGTGSGSGIANTFVNIDTAVHYGKVNAINKNYYSSINYSQATGWYNYDNYYYQNESDFIFPDNNGHNLSIYPNKKRGFGGIFGRLQRGSYGAMQSDEFKNIMNMDPSVDMIGRADQSSYGSLIYYRFSVSGVADSYYTARYNDTTPATVVGYISTYNSNQTISSYDAEYSLRKSGTIYYINSLKITNGTGTHSGNVTRTVALYNKSNPGAAASTQTISYSNMPIYNFNLNLSYSTRTITQNNCASYGLTWAEVTGANYISNNAELIKLNNTISYSTKATPGQYYVKRVTEDDNPSTGIYHSSFPLMVTQSDYIYHANNAVLADRFRLAKVIENGVEKDNPYYREKGMYVLATEKGRLNGAVLPINIKVDGFFKINEESANTYLDLNNIPISQLISDVNNNPIINEYKSIFQTRLNDKSYILPEAKGSTLGDITLYDPTGSAPTLRGGVINNTTKTITFTASITAFPNLVVKYSVLSATLSENAVIAVSNITAGNHASFNQAYEARDSNILTGDYASTINMTLINAKTNTFPQKITVYSEIAANVAGLVELSDYKTDYTIVIDLKNTTLNISFTNINLDGTTFNPPTVSNNIYTLPSNRIMKINGTIKLTFSETTNLLPLGHTLFLEGLYYKVGTTEHLVPSSYYSVIHEGKVSSTNKVFTMTISINEEFKGGNYLIKYRYYSNTTLFTISFQKEASSEKSITDLQYDTYSADAEGLNLAFSPKNDDFTSYLAFGIELAGINYQTARELTPQLVPYESVPVFINSYNYYLIKYGDIVIAQVSLSNFASLVSVNASFNFNQTTKLKYYTFTYEIKSEAELAKGASGVSSTIVNTISERPLPTSIIVYNNGNLDDNRPIAVTREAQVTTLSLDFGMPQHFNDNISTLVYLNDELYLFDDSKIVFDVSDYYDIIIKYQLEAGTKRYVFSLDRGYGVSMPLGYLNIKKNEGITAYLWDINFQVGSDTRLIYPFIYEANLDGSINEDGKKMRLYYDGIDYVGADLEGKKHFRIDGLVSDIDLESYSPEFFLPAGAKIYRKVGTNGWTEDLFTSFISEDENIAQPIIVYKVVPEDGNEANEVYYYITANDLDYNLTIRFAIYYEFEDGTIVSASDINSPINDRVILIVTRNFSLKDKDANDETIEYKVTEEDGKTIYPFEGEIVDYITAMKSQSVMFYYPFINPHFLYTFARNYSGCYGFTIITPIYNGTTDNELVNGERYSYDIYLTFGTEPTPSNPYPWYNDNRLLPELDETGERTGKYFFIEGELNRNRVREFAIVIKASTSGSSWGLHDDTTSWDQIHG